MSILNFVLEACQTSSEIVLSQDQYELLCEEASSSLTPEQQADIIDSKSLNGKKFNIIKLHTGANHGR